MGTEGLWIPAVMAAVGAGASYENTRQVNKRQDRTLADQITAGSRRNREAEALVNETLQRQAASSAEGERASASDQYLSRLQQTAGTARSGLQQAGRVSDAYASGAEGAAGDIASFGARTADLMSRIDAPIRQRQNEGIDFGRLGTDLGLVSGASNSDRYLGDLRMRSIQRDPWLDVLSSAATSYAANYSPGTGSGGGTGGGTRTVNTRGRGYLNA